MKKFLVMMMACLLVFGFVSCDSSGGYYNATLLDGTWSRSGGYYKLKFTGNKWVYEENGANFAKGIWSSAFTIEAPSSGTATIKATNINNGSGWSPFPSQNASVQTNTVTFSIDNTGTVLTISDAQYKTPGIWGTTEGTYSKQ